MERKLLIECIEKFSDDSYYKRFIPRAHFLLSTIYESSRRREHSQRYWESAKSLLSKLGCSKHGDRMKDYEDMVPIRFR